MSDLPTSKEVGWQAGVSVDELDTTNALCSPSQVKKQQIPKLRIYSHHGLIPGIYTPPGDFDNENPVTFNDLPAKARETLYMQFGEPTPLGPGPRYLTQEQLTELKLTSPPDTPLYSEGGAIAITRESDLPDSVFQFPDSTGHIHVRGVKYPSSEIRDMNAQLVHARQTGYFPHSIAPPTDFEALVDDYEMLCQLREIRGDLTSPFPKAWTNLRVEVARKIVTRDTAKYRGKGGVEAASRMDSYLTSVGVENRMFQQDDSSGQVTPVTSMAPVNPASPVSAVSPSLYSPVGQQQMQTLLPSPLPTPPPSQTQFGEQLFSAVENAVEQNMAQAAAPMRMNMSRHASLNQEFSDVFRQQQAQAQQQHIAFGQHFNIFQQHNSQHSNLLNNAEQMQNQYNDQLNNFGQHNNMHSNLLTNFENIQNDHLTKFKKLHRQASTNSLAMTSQVDALGNLIIPQQQNLETTAQNLGLSAGLVSNLTNIVNNLPSTINQAVDQAVQDQTKIAMQHVLQNQTQFQEQLLHQQQQHRQPSPRRRLQSHHRGLSSLDRNVRGALSQWGIKAMVRAFTAQMQRSPGGISRSPPSGRRRDGVRSRRGSPKRKLGDSSEGSI